MIGKRVGNPLAFLASLGLVASLGLLACEGNPTAPEHEEELTVELEIAPGHAHILQTAVEFTVRVRDGHGQAVTDFEAIQVERLQEGSDTWRAIELALDGDVYRGTYTFGSSGAYGLRVMGQRHGEAEMRLLHEAHDPLHVARAHEEAGGYRIEFESFPGHIHEGETATLRFWVMETETDADGVRPPVPGLGAQVHCLGSEAGEEFHGAVEAEPGLYEAAHTFGEAEETHAGLHFTGSDGQPAEAEFHLHIAHGH